ncbi:tryptophan halogenase family protein [Alteromonas sp. ASW11-130]|uniref:tryptophan halogenase family protein n=1 Tax=Alteromonas sp. ASW11-130 TaxID=3015775 RepID=UPI0022428012|nr:tryptophan halogenase family protein [Alteromonas sp. ASW11-130]MCW8090951.1 tryptophan 7-halogenase [Alteromonas sp. ASW11-130]
MKELKHVVIVGGGTAGWIAANLLAHRLNQANVTVSLIESPDINTIGVGEGSTPTLKRFFATLGIADSQWMPQCNATYKLNIRFRDWSPGNGIDEYCHPFTSQVDTFTKRAFLVNSRTRRLGLDTHTKPEDFLINGVLSNQGKGPTTPENFPFIIEYGYHFDAMLLANFLSKHAKGQGVVHKQAKVVEVKVDESGDIDSVILDSGEPVHADFFIDASGFRGLLIGQTLNEPFTSFKQNLFNDSAVVMPTPQMDSFKPETLATALSNGWCWKIPLINRNGNGYVYSSDFTDHDSAETELRRHLGLLDADVEARKLSMRVGQRERHWVKNCLAVGLSQGFIEPLEATALHLVQITLESFLTNVKGNYLDDSKQPEFNHSITHRFERVRDYIVAHYKLNSRHDSEYWRAGRDINTISASLAGILDTWFKKGDLEAEVQRQQIQHHFDAVSWNCLLSGYGVFPPLAHNQPGKGDLYTEQQVSNFLNRCALNFTSHNENLFFH